MNPGTTPAARLTIAVAMAIAPSASAELLLPPGHEVLEVALGRGINPSVYVLTGPGEDGWDHDVQSSIHRSADSGASWTTIDLPIGSSSWLRVVGPKNATRLVVGGRDGLVISTDDGSSWRELEVEVPVERGLGLPLPLAFYPSTASAAAENASLWVGVGAVNTGDRPLTLPRGVDFSLLHKIDLGSGRWTSAVLQRRAINVGEPFRLKWVSSDPSSSDVVYAVLEADDRLFRTEDGGTTWEVMSSSFGDATAFVVDPYVPGRLHAIFGLGLNRSVDSGRTWTQAMVMTQSGVRHLAVNPGQRDRVFAIAFGTGILISTDGGQVYAPTSAGMELQMQAADSNAVALQHLSPGGAYWIGVAPDNPSFVATFGPTGLHQLDEAALTPVLEGGMVPGIDRHERISQSMANTTTVEGVMELARKTRELAQAEQPPATGVRRQIPGFGPFEAVVGTSFHLAGTIPRSSFVSTQRIGVRGGLTRQGPSSQFEEPDGTAIELEPGSYQLLLMSTTNGQMLKIFHLEVQEDGPDVLELP